MGTRANRADIVGQRPDHVARHLRIHHLFISQHLIHRRASVIPGTHDKMRELRCVSPGIPRTASPLRSEAVPHNPSHPSILGTPAELDLHLIVDNYATHKHPKVQSWLKRHRRFHVHFIPTSSSWLNLVERWFREITDKRLRRGTFRSVEQLIDAIVAFIKEHNDNPQSYVWTAKADEILAKIERARKVLQKTPTA